MVVSVIEAYIGRILSHARKVTLAVLQAIMFASVRIVPFYTEPYTGSTVDLSDESDCTNVS